MMVTSEQIRNASEDKKGKPGSYTRRVALAFVAVAALTALIIVSLLAVVWGSYFNEYAQSNMKRLSDSVAESLAKEYEINGGSWYGGALAPASTVSNLYEAVNVTVVDASGKPIFSDVTAPRGEAFGAGKGTGSTSSDIMVHGEKVGTVYVSVFGSDSLLTAQDHAFLGATYQAIALAAFAALVIALIVGILFSRALVHPINTITNAANRIKEGDYSARSELEGDDEISRLGATFDAMAESIEQNRNLERRLVSDCAHELRTPLMAIQATVEAIIDGVYEASSERLESLDSEVRRLARLVDALLKLSRLENRANPVEMTRLDLSDLLESVAESHEAFVEDSNLTFEFEHEPGVVVMGNADMIRQATANLISNAVRYTPEGGTVTLSVKKGDIMGQIMVKDTGIGLTPEEAKQVFGRFWRADRGRARESGGLGIGLSIVKEIVDRHNGWVHVEGRPNEGACFTIYIPLVHEARDQNARRRLGGEKTERISLKNGIFTR